MRANKEIFAEYGKRFRMLRSEHAVSPEEIKENITKALAGKDVSANIINNWSNAYRSVPPIGVLAVIAKTLHTSCSYLVGQHDIHSFEVSAEKLDTSVDRIKKIYREEKGISMYSDPIVAPNWINSKVKHGVDILDRTSPYLKICEEIHVWIDYLLGISKFRNEAEYAFFSGTRKDVLEGHILTIKNKETGTSEYGIVMPGGNDVVVKSGNTVPLEEFKDSGANLVKKVIV